MKFLKFQFKDNGINVIKTEMRMLRKISGNTKKDMIQNKEICLKIGVIDEIMRETGKLLKMVWFGHI